MPQVTANLKGLVSGFQLGPRSAEKAVLEAVMNSVQATADRFKKQTRGQGNVEVVIERDPSLLDDPVSRQTAPIIAIEIRDNGIGFDAENFASFLEVGSQRKLEIGGKGVGRLSWLKLGREAHVTSTFEGEGGLRFREFCFTVDADEIDDRDREADEAESSAGPRTVVRLTGLRNGYRQNLPKTLETWASRVADHLLLQILKGNCPRITVAEADGCGRIPVNEDFLTTTLLQREEQRVEVHGQDLAVTLTRLKRTGGGGSQVLLCANGRTIEEPAVTQVVPNLPATLFDPGGEGEDGPGAFDFVMLVEGALLDERGNMERTRLDIEDEPSPLYAEEVSRKDILRAVAPVAKRFLEPYLLRVEEANLARARRRIVDRHVDFRPLLKFRQARIKALQPNLSDDDFDAALFRINEDYTAELRRKAKRLLNDAGPAPTEEERRQTFKKFVGQWNEMGQARLAHYVMHRRVTLDLLERRLGRQDDGKSHKEDAVHELIFPMRATSDDVTADRSNLWLIDERLNFHQFLASDLPLKQYANTASTKEPDIAVFDHVFAFTEDGGPVNSFYLVEFKRPHRRGYDVDPSKEGNPVGQLLRYVDLLREGQQEDIKSRAIQLAPGARCHAYLVCDLTKKLGEVLRYNSFQRTPDGEGWYQHIGDMHTTVEVLTYSKLLRDAKSRNAMLFRKLGLDGPIGVG